MARTAERAARAQMCLQVLLQDTAGLDEQAAIDRLVRHLAGLVAGIGVLEPPRNLLWRPVVRQLGSDQLPQLFMPRELALLRPESAIPCPLVRGCGAIPSVTAIAPQLAADGRRRTMQLRSNRSERTADSNPARDLLALIEAEHAPRSPPRWRTDAAVRLQMREDCCVPSTNDPTDQVDTFAPLPAIPNLGTLRRCEHAALSSLRHRITSPRSRYQCCVDLLRPPSIPDTPAGALLMRDDYQSLILLDNISLTAKLRVPLGGVARERGHLCLCFAVCRCLPPLQRQLFFFLRPRRRRPQ